MRRAQGWDRIKLMKPAMSNENPESINAEERQRATLKPSDKLIRGKVSSYGRVLEQDS